MAIGIEHGTRITPVEVSPANVHAPVANTAAVVTYAGVAGLKHVITGIAWSYAGTPVGGTVTLEDGAGTTVFELDIMESGHDNIMFARPMKSSTANTDMIITLAPGGAGVIGKLAIANYWTEV